MTEEQKTVIYVISVNADTSLAPCVFSMIGAEEFIVDADGVTPLNPYTNKHYVPKDGDTIIEVLDQDLSGWKTALVDPVHGEDPETIYEYLSTIFKFISLYKIKINNPNEFDPWDWEDYAEKIFEKHQWGENY